MYDVFSTWHAYPFSFLQSEEFTQTHLDILYARYLQQVFLESKAKHDFRLQEQHAMVIFTLMYSHDSI